MSVDAPAPEEKPGTPPPTGPMAYLMRSDLLVDSGLPPLVFLAVNIFASLKVAAIVAVVLSVLIVGFRVSRGNDPTYAISGVFATGIAVFIALRTGHATGVLWPSVVRNGVLALALTGSVLFKKPAIGFFLETIAQIPSRWWQHDRVRPAFSVWTLVWAAVSAFKGVVILVLILTAGKGLTLGVSFALGYPVTAALVFGGWAYIRARLKAMDAPPLESFKAPTPAPA